MFVLLIFFSLNGEPQRQEIPQPDYRTCLAEKELWMKHVNRKVFIDPQAHCVVRDLSASPAPPS